jgi:putative membrane protein (TIGR04086 family)
MLKYLKHLGYIVGSVVIGIMFFTIFNYFGIINNSIMRIIKIVLVVISTFISAYLLGKVSKSKGYIEGLKLGLLVILLLVIMNLIFSSFSLSKILYFLLILFTAILGSMIGINRKKETTKS